MKNLLIIAILTILISCNKQQPITPQTSSTINNPTQTPCNQYGACMDGVYKFEPCNTCWGIDNDTVMNSNAKIKYTFIGYEHKLGQPWKDSLKYRLDYVNFDIEIFTHFTDYIYRSHGYNWHVIQLSTKTNKNVIFNRNL